MNEFLDRLFKFLAELAAKVQVKVVHKQETTVIVRVRKEDEDEHQHS